MKPSKGRIVLVGTKDKNGQDLVVAAIIVKVWSDICINVRVFFDGCNDVKESTSEWITSVTLDINSDIPSNMHWIWPPKV